MLRINPRFHAVSTDALHALRSIDTLLFGLRLADLDTYHYQCQYQLWVCKLMILDDAVAIEIFFKKEVRSRGAWFIFFVTEICQLFG
jgi:hypothetical protein